jgi:hypothetical protein
MQIQRHQRAASLLRSPTHAHHVCVPFLRRLLLTPALVLVAFLPTRQPIVTWTSRGLARLWEEPVDPASANLFDGPWAAIRHRIRTPRSCS